MIPATLKIVRQNNISFVEIFFLNQYLGNIFLSNNFQSRSNRTVATIAGSIMYLCDPCDCATPATPKILVEKKYFISIPKYYIV